MSYAANEALGTTKPANLYSVLAEFNEEITRYEGAVDSLRIDVEVPLVGAPELKSATGTADAPMPVQTIIDEYKAIIRRWRALNQRFEDSLAHIRNAIK